MTGQPLYEQGAGKPQIQLPPQRCMCGIHGAAFRPKWPMGYPVYVTKAMARLNECVEFLKGLDGTVQSVQDQLDVKPLCCVLADQDPDLLAHVFREVHELTKTDPQRHLFEQGKCVRCKRTDLCVFSYEIHKPYSPHGGTRLVAKHKRICVRCIARRNVAVDPARRWA